MFREVAVTRALRQVKGHLESVSGKLAGGDGAGVEAQAVQPLQPLHCRPARHCPSHRQQRKLERWEVEALRRMDDEAAAEVQFQVHTVPLLFLLQPRSRRLQLPEGKAVEGPPRV